MPEVLRLASDKNNVALGVVYAAVLHKRLSACLSIYGYFRADVKFRLELWGKDDSYPKFELSRSSNRLDALPCGNVFFCFFGFLAIFFLTNLHLYSDVPGVFICSVELAILDIHNFDLDVLFYMVFHFVSRSNTLRSGVDIAEDGVFAVAARRRSNRTHTSNTTLSRETRLFVIIR